MEFYVKISFISILSLFFWVLDMILSDADVTRIAALNTASDYVTN